MPTDILLVASNFEEVSLISAKGKGDKGIKLDENSHYPLGLAYLHSYLEMQGNNVHTLALNHVDFETCIKTVINTIEKISPKVVGLQILTPNRVSSYRIIEYVHEHYPGIQLVVGGIHASIMYRQLLEKYPFLIAVLGEGELTFAELLEVLYSESQDLNSVEGIAFSKDKAISVTKPRGLIENLDDLPFPKHDLFFKGNRNSGCILTSRGCPFHCSFCSLDSISRRRVRLRSIKNVVDEIEYMVENFPLMTNIWIHDDSFFLDNDRVIAFCDEIVRRGIKTKFIASGRMKPLKKEMIKKLEQANFVMVLLGLESGDEGILKACHKQITQKDAINAFKLFSHSSIELCAFLIVGLPGETLETINETANFIKKLQKIKYMYYDNIAILTVYPGTEVYKIAQANRMINDDVWLKDEPTPVFTVENDIDQLFEFKQILLDNISFNRIFTITGIKSQFTMIPYIIMYLIRYRFKDFIRKIMRLILHFDIFKGVKWPSSASER
jgi:anaerobic magnesium-protoporphyrin IX monomethyl ester cyclase